MNARPLEGVRVLDLAIGDAGVVARDLAMLGADVIRVEAVGGGEDRQAEPVIGGTSIPFLLANRGKRATAVEFGSDAFEALLRDADILIENFVPDARSDFDPSVIVDRFPKLVVLSISDFGRLGRYAAWRGGSPVFHALSGELSRSGIPDREPLLPPGDLAVQCALAQAGWVVLAAYYRRLTTGVGDHVDFSLQDGAALALDPGYGIGGSATSGVPASQLPCGRPEARFQYPIVACADGHVRICVLAPRQWQGMFEWLGRPDEFSSPELNAIHARFANRDLIPAIARLFADKGRFELEAEGRHYGVPTAAVLSLDEAVVSDQMAAREAFATIELAPGKAVRVADGVIEIDGVRATTIHAAPALAEDIAWHDRADAGAGRPFEELRVLDMGIIIVGADTGRLFGDMGAEVIKVENKAYPDGSRQSKESGRVSIGFAMGHRNKQGLGLNLRTPEGKALLLQLVAQSDVVLSNFKPGTLESLGLDHATLAVANPGIVVVDSSAFGPSGPWSRSLGYGPLVRASTGLTSLWKFPGEPDGFADALTVYPDHAAARYGAIGALALLIRRMRTGRGGTVSISQAEVSMSHFATLIAARSIGQALPHIDAPNGVFRCAGADEWCVVAVRTPAEFDALREVLGPGDDVSAALSAWLAKRSPQDAMEILQKAGVPAGAMLRVSDMPDCDYFQAREMFAEVTHPEIEAPFVVERAPVRARNLPTPRQDPAPLVGEHSRAIADRLLRLDVAEIDRLIAESILEAPADATNLTA